MARHRYIIGEITMLKNLKITEYELLWNEPSLRCISLQIRRGIGCERWAIARGDHDCLGKTSNSYGYFIFARESLSSSRDDAYFREYRFDTAEEAFRFWQDNRQYILATPEEYLEFVRMAKRKGCGTSADEGYQ